MSALLSRPIPSPQIDLPLAHDAAGRFLPRIIGFMTYLAAIALVALAVLSSAGAGWRQSLSGTLTVEVMPAADGEATEAFEARVAAVVALLRDTPGVARVEPLPADRMTALLEPWLGREGLGEDVKLPRLVDVAVDPASRLDSAALATRVAETVPGARLDDHEAWLKTLLGVIGVVEVAALGVIVLICAAAITTVIFTTRTGLAIHRDEIELLHLLGAADSYVARQFARTAGLGALWGSLAGLALAALTVYAAQALVGPTANALLPAIDPGISQLAPFLVLPAAAVAITAITAYSTVMRSLARVL